MSSENPLCFPSLHHMTPVMRKTCHMIGGNFHCNYRIRRACCLLQLGQQQKPVSKHFSYYLFSYGSTGNILTLTLSCPDFPCLQKNCDLCLPMRPWEDSLSTLQVKDQTFLMTFIRHWVGHFLDSVGDVIAHKYYSTLPSQQKCSCRQACQFMHQFI